MDSKNIIIVPETHWDREWYLPFQEYRARLVIMMDKLLDVLKQDPNYTNFTLDGQVIPLEDYLEVRPEKKEEIVKYVKEKRLSIGPSYVLPDEFLISGESLIRNLMIGHQISRSYGRVMKAGYIPDPFGHIAQLPQILKGFELPSIIFQRGFGDEFETQKLNMEFIWKSPGSAASILAIHLILGYGSVADLNFSDKSGDYIRVLNKLKEVVSKLENYTATPIVLLNSGSDHHEAHPELPEIISRWNKKYPDKIMEQNDFEYYISKVLECKPQLKSYQGELRGGKYSNIIASILSTRMWIKQRNTKIEYLFEKYTEPFSTITWILDKYHEFPYPASYIQVGFKWLIKNHPHDSICGCSIDQVHNEMSTRFDWAEQIGNEIIKNSFLYLIRLIGFKKSWTKIPLFVFNPLPWERKDLVEFNFITEFFGYKTSTNFKVIDTNGEEIEYQYIRVEEEPRFKSMSSTSYLCCFLAEMPALGYKIYYLVPGKKAKTFPKEDKDFKMTQNTLENQFFLVKVNLNGMIDVYDKKAKKWYEKIFLFEDVGDWGDEYDFSGPNENQTDLIYTSEDLNFLGIKPYIDGSTQKTIKLDLNLNLPESLSEDRFNREPVLVSNLITIYITLYKEIKRIDFKLELENKSKDHRIRVLFPTGIESEKVDCDGHFYIISRNVEIPKVDNWYQNPRPTNHQKDFISVNDRLRTFAILNKGLPEYETIKNPDGTISLAITILRCIEWLSRDDFVTRRDMAGPAFNTPEAQCLGKHSFDLSLIIEENKSGWLESEIHVKGKEFNNPFKVLFLNMLKLPFRMLNKTVLFPTHRIVGFGLAEDKPVEPVLPLELSFLKIDNNKIVLSILKRSEEGNYLIIRLYNISPNYEKATLRFCEQVNFKSAEIVNLLEVPPINEIKATVQVLDKKTLLIELQAHVIATIRILNLNSEK
ncbi:MAG: alpha-mannosidase [Promethearchaeota archaeon]